MGPLRYGRETPDYDASDVANSHLIAAKEGAANEEAPPYYPESPDAGLQKVEAQDNPSGGPPSIVYPISENHSFRPKYLSDVFLSITPSIHLQSLKECLNALIITYYSHQRIVEADLLLTYSVLPQDATQDPDPQTQQIPQMLIEAGLFAAQGDVVNMLAVSRRIIAAGDSNDNLGTRFVAIDYAIIMSKLKRPEEAEMVINKMFYGHISKQTEYQSARELQTGYVWVKKTLAVAQRLRGRPGNSLQTLQQTLETARVVFGTSSLSSLHAVFLLQDFYDEEGPAQFRDRTEAAGYAEEFLNIFQTLYGGGDGGGNDEGRGARKGGVCSREGLQAGMILWAQGALVEAVQVFDAFARLSAAARDSLDDGEDRLMVEKAGRAGNMARRDLEKNLQVDDSTRGSILGFGTIMFQRKLEDLEALLGG